MMPARIMVVFGTRPEAVKMAPVVRELHNHPGLLVPVVCVTAQHREMLDQVLELFELQPDHDLNVMRSNQSLSDLTCNVLNGIDDVLRRESIDMVLVQGDTTTTFAAALAAFYQKVPVGHIEAGLRTYDRHNPFPEELNRVLTTRLADVHFAPTREARENLLQEGISDEQILVTGNTVIDALLSIVDQVNESCGNGHVRRRILVTAHRRESFGKPLEEVCRAILDLVEQHADVEVVFPVHLNPHVRTTVHGLLAGHERIHLSGPLGYAEFSRELAKAHLVLTDSGGVQEEAPSLGKPVLVLRNETERQEGIAAGTCRLVGTDRERIVREATRLLTDTEAYDAMAHVANPYGDGEASRRIVQWILNRFESTGRTTVASQDDSC